MSWLAVKYALACRDERVKGSVRLVLVALGARVEYRRITTTPTSLSDLRWLTFLSYAQLRRVLDTLEETGQVRRLSRGKNATYGLAKMAGPLFVWTDTEPLKMSDFVIESLPSKTAQDARKVTGRVSGFSRRRAGGVLFSQVLSTQVPPTTERAAAADLPDDVREYLTWWRTTYPLYNRGAVSTPDLERDGVRVAALLAQRTLYRLQEMAIVLWLVDRHEEPWIAGSDRSLLVLRHKANWLDRRVSEQPTWWRVCPHIPKCNDRSACDVPAEQTLARAGNG